MSVWMRTSVAAMMLAAVTACGSYNSPTSPSPTNTSATIVSGGFMPNPITISVTSTVTWTNSDTVAHTIVADSGVFRSGTIAPGGKYSYQFPSAGTFNYHDAANAGMAGTVNVSGSSSGSRY